MSSILYTICLSAHSSSVPSFSVTIYTVNGRVLWISVTGTMPESDNTERSGVATVSIIFFDTSFSSPISVCRSSHRSVFSMSLPTMIFNSFPIFISFVYYCDASFMPFIRVQSNTLIHSPFILTGVYHVSCRMNADLHADWIIL